MELNITVERVRHSVTQGEAAVYINGEKIAQFGDDPKLLEPGEKYYGPNIGGYASTTPDTVFIRGVLYHDLDDYYRFSEKVKKMLDTLQATEEAEAKTKKGAV